MSILVADKTIIELETMLSPKEWDDYSSIGEVLSDCVNILYIDESQRFFKKNDDCCMFLMPVKDALPNNCLNKTDIVEVVIEPRKIYEQVYRSKIIDLIQSVEKTQ